MLAEPCGGNNQTMVLSVPYKPRLTVAQALLPARKSRQLAGAQQGVAVGGASKVSLAILAARTQPALGAGDQPSYIGMMFDENQQRDDNRSSHHIGGGRVPWRVKQVHQRRQ